MTVCLVNPVGMLRIQAAVTSFRADRYKRPYRKEPPLCRADDAHLGDPGWPGDRDDDPPLRAFRAGWLRDGRAVQLLVDNAVEHCVRTSVGCQRMERPDVMHSGFGIAADVRQVDKWERRQR